MFFDVPRIIIQTMLAVMSMPMVFSSTKVVNQNDLFPMVVHRGPLVYPVFCTASYVIPPHTVVTNAHCGVEWAKFRVDPHDDVAYWTSQETRVGLNYTTSIKTYDEIHDGDKVCMYSNTLRMRQCGTVVKRDVRNPLVEGHLTDLEITMDNGWPLTFGDSGTPVTTPDGKTLVGIFSDRVVLPDGRSVFTAATVDLSRRPR